MLSRPSICCSVRLNSLRIARTLFFDRLDAELLQDAINYIEYDEKGLAFETICDHISEYNIPITSEEYL
ncbi:MafI family immunity protein [Proteus faecis]|uniref:MafI family immunity protein n=1 Tax=Proteus faecis TaxID=2050967 RepID=A0AAW7CTC9_9GAMM|nr:MafI family immunity protein [Proteus faecis]MDO5404078.1 MafI family immunity protein [Proteus sp. (in: enterobacteria)]MDL5167484.1 MafI family immunity protein [Proteus faecis]MDL5275467.1 MafI family immunity protein [Proteus faecis]MDL5279036.1 MafI family immunity protein [Proteus faecis]MDL5307844.1 MafI family immunity protein [Proteus faecis]